MRLIDADMLSRIVKLAWDTSDSEDFEKSVFIAIETAPTIDPVKHGRWVTVRVCGRKVDACTNCGDVVEHCEVLKYDFCPWCGARMDGEEG